MNCEELFKVLPDYLDAEMRREICRELEAHMLICPDCRVHVRTLKETVHLAQSLPPSPIHQEWVSRLRERVLSAKPPTATE